MHPLLQRGFRPLMSHDVVFWGNSEDHDISEHVPLGYQGDQVAHSTQRCTPSLRVDAKVVEQARGEGGRTGPQHLDHDLSRKRPRL